MKTSMRSLTLLIVYGMLSPPVLGQTGPATRVADLADGPVGVAPFHLAKLTVLGDTLFFAAVDGVSGEELWKTDGTAAGTEQVADICPGACSSRIVEGIFSGYSSQGFFIVGPVAAGDEVFFAAEDGVRGRQLWRSDGSATGTRAVDDFDPYHTALHGIEELTAWQDRVFFVASDREHGPELRRAGGGEPGAVLVADIGPGESGAGIGRLVSTPAGLFFTAFDDRQVWVSDGTVDGTRLVIDAHGIIGGRVGAVLAAGAGVLFTIRDDFGRVSLWTSDGSDDGTELILDLGSKSVANLTTVDGRGTFQVFSGDGQALWSSDGTAAGTVEIGSLPGFISGPRYAAYQGALYYALDDRLWRAGAAGPPALVAEFDADVRELAGAGGGLFVFTDDNVLWRSVEPSGPFEPVAAAPPFAYNLTAFGDRVYFNAITAELGRAVASVGVDGDVAFVTDFEVPDSSDPSFFTDHQGTLLFATDQGLFESRGTAATTAQIDGVSPDARAVSVAGGAYVFDDPELRIYDGDGRSTLLRDDLERSYPDTAAELGGSMFFVSATPTEFVLWTSDGTPSGSVAVESFDRLREVCLQPTSTYCRRARAQSAILDGAVLLLLEDELRRSDGLPDGTVQIFDATAIDDGGGCWLDHLTRVETPVGERVFFTSTGHEAPTLLWVSDGTVAGTEVVVELAPADGDLSYLQRFEVSPLPSPATDFTAFAGKLFFALRTPEIGDELWMSDGTAAGTMPVRDLRAGPHSSYPRGLSVAGGRLYFAAEDGTSGHELWASDGTAAGTKPVADILPGAGSSYPRGLTVAGERLLFAARDEEHGLELWQSSLDRTSAVIVQDVDLGGGSSSPRHLTVSGLRLYFNAFTADAGFELWSAAITDLPAPAPCPECFVREFRGRSSSLVFPQ